MSNKTYYKCDECGISFPEDDLVMTDKLDLNCLECVEESKRNHRVHNLVVFSCIALALFGAYVTYKYFTK